MPVSLGRGEPRSMRVDGGAWKVVGTRRASRYDNRLPVVSDPNSPDFDESGRLFAPRYGDIYRGGGSPEADWDELEVFLGGNDLRERFRALPSGATFTIGETGFGTALSCLRAADTFLELAPASSRLHFVSVEAHPLPRAILERCHSPYSVLDSLAVELRAQWPIEPQVEPVRPLHRIALAGGRVVLFLLLGDAESLLPAHPFAADAWFLDGFAPSCNPAMWSRATLGAVASSTRPGGTFATWSVASAVLERLESFGFEVEKRPGVGRKRLVSAGRLAERLRPERTGRWWRQSARAESSSRPTQVAILGDGVAAASTASALADRGVEVFVVVPAGVRRAASDLPVGVLEPRLWNGNVPDAELVARAFAWTHRWLTSDPGRMAAAKFVACGALHAVLDESVQTRTRARVEHVATLLPIEWMSPEAASAKLGGPTDEVSCFGGAWIPQAGCLSPASLCQSLFDHPRIHRVDTTPTDVDLRIIAAGGGSIELLPELPIDAVGGQVTRIPARPDSPLECVVSTAGHVTPVWYDGHHHAGSTYRPIRGECEPRSRRTDDEQNVARATRAVPHLRDGFSPPSWTGIRAVTADRLPLVGALPDRTEFETVFAAFLTGGRPPLERDAERIWSATQTYVQTAHASRGLATAPFAGEILAGILCGEVLPLREDLVRRLAPVRTFVREIRRRQNG